MRIEYAVFGDSPVIVLLALVLDTVENCVHVPPPFVLYSHMSHVVEAVADTITEDAVISLVDILIVGALRSILTSAIVPPCSVTEEV